MTRAFIIRGFGKKKDREGQEFDFDRVEADLIRPAMAVCGLTGGTTATEEDAGNIREDMFAMILAADVVICDITVHNANVFYELGIRHALRKKHTVMIRGEASNLADTHRGQPARRHGAAAGPDRRSRESRERERQGLVARDRRRPGRPELRARHRVPTGIGQHLRTTVPARAARDPVDGVRPGDP